MTYCRSVDQWVNPAGQIAGFSFAGLLSLRHRVPDGTLLDALELAQLLRVLPCRVRRAELEGHWQLTQPALHRRLRRLQRAGLLDYETEHGTVWINRLGLCEELQHDPAHGQGQGA